MPSITNKDPPAKGAVPAVLIVAVAIACGIASAQAVPDVVGPIGAVLMWVGAAGVVALGSLACLTATDGGRWTGLAGAAMCAGLSVGIGDLRTGLGSAHEGVVRVVGRVSSAPRETATGADVLARHAHGSASVVFELEVTAVCTGDHTELPVSASVIVRVQELGAAPPRGSFVRLTGWYRPPGQSMNPGSRASSGDGSVSVPALALITPVDSVDTTVVQRARAAANMALNQSFPEWAPPSWRALVKAMTTGVREPALVVPGSLFRMAGMSHVLAISGFNVAVLVGAAAAFASMLGAGITLRALAALLISVLFLVITEPEVSVLRAGLGAGLAAIVGIRGGRARGLGALGAVAALSLLLDPGSLFNAGFQLSYGVVLGLLTLAGPPAERWNRRAMWLLERTLPWRWASGEWVRISVGMFVGACISSIVAFTVSTPIALWHGGFASTYAAPISVITMPAAALVTIGGVIAIVVHPMWPSLALLPGAMSCACAGFLDWVAQSAADFPGTCWWIGRPALWWLVAAVVCVASAWKLQSAHGRRVAWACLVLLAAAAWLGAARPFAGSPAAGVLRVEALDVGNGSCLLIRAGSSSLLYDAGTSSDDSAGSRRVVPALAALGIRRIDALILSHTHMEHFSAVPEVVRAFDVRRIVVPQPLKDQAAQGREGALRTLCQWLAARGLELEAHVDGDELRVGTLSVRVLGPELGADAAVRGDESLVVRVRSILSQNPSAAALLTGGLRQAGCDALRARAARNPDLLPPTAICEMPSHGFWSESAAALLASCKPQVLLQSVGASRIRRDRWEDRTPAMCIRGTTARLGALRAEVDSNGAAELFHWTGTSWQRVTDL